ncbi:MAG: DNA cytosine methyltransferase [Prevotellaceae bacterium]|nr:DNA cytosine methyltransferase [Prevotellaceae bacterium]
MDKERIESIPTFIDLFSGCGGLSLGFEMAGLTSVLAIDNWQDALVTYEHNRTGARTLCGDLSIVDPFRVREEYQISKVDVIIGGPPCQGFSVAGKRIIEDKRNNLYKAFVGFVDCFRPKAFVMENVPNILGIGGGIVRDSIIRDFEKLGYTINVKVLTASDYGVPQNRKRAFFVGLSGKQGFEFPQPLDTPKVTAYEALCDLTEDTIPEGASYPTEAMSEYQGYARTDSKGVYNHEITIHTERTKEIIRMVPDGGNYKDLPVELQQTRKVHIAWTRLCSTKPSFTIDCGHRHHFHYKWDRIPTVRESARIQSFPDDFIFMCSKTSQYKQVGNAVPPLMAKAIALKLSNTLWQEKK